MMNEGMNEKINKEPASGDEMNEITMHMIRNSGPGGLRSSTLPLGHRSSP